MNPKNLAMFQFILLTILVLGQVTCEVYHLPTTVSQQIEYIRLSSIHEIDEPKLELNNIYKKSVKKDDGTGNSTESSQFEACQEYSAEVDFEYIGYCAMSMKEHANESDFKNDENSRSLIYDYEMLKSQHRHIVDMTYYNNHVFTISSKGVVRIYKIDEKLPDGIELKKTIDAILWQNIIDRRMERLNKEIEKKKGTANQTYADQINQGLPQYLKFHHISKGYFQLMDETQLMLFGNGQVLIGIDIKTLKTTLLSEQTEIEIIFDDDEDFQDDDDDDDFQDDQEDQEWDEDDDEDQEDQDYDQQDQELALLDQDEDYEQYNFEDDGYSLRIFNIYKYLENFESLTKIDETHFAVLDRKLGIIIYEVLKSTDPSSQFMYYLDRVDFIQKQDFWYAYGVDEPMNLVDIKYSKEKGLLLVLDYNKGVFAFDRVKVIGKSNKFEFILSSNRIIKKQCNLMEYSGYSSSLYLSCNKIYKISLSKWPLVQQKSYTHPMIHIRQIFAIEQQNILVFVGYSIFKILYLDRLADYYEDEMLDKIIFHDSSKVVTANEDAIYVYNYELLKPAILCQTEDQSLLGTHEVMLETMAECVKEHHPKHTDKTKTSEQGKIQEDICVYSTYKTIIIWKQGQIPVQTMAIIFIVGSILSTLLFLWIITTVFRRWRAKRFLDSLSTATHQVLVEEGEQKSSKLTSISDIQNKVRAQTGEPIRKGSDSLNSDSGVCEKF